MKNLYLALLVLILGSSGAYAQYFGGDGDGAAMSALGGPGTEVVLPIKLLYFDAKFTQEKVVTAWSVASQTNNDYFSIERGTDGVNFTTIGTLAGLGSNTQKIDYSFIDGEPLIGNSYYRLKQTDFDGKYEYSNIVAVSTNHTVDIQLYPNPSNGNFIISGTVQNADLAIINARGEKVLSQQITSLLTNIDISSLPNGIYYAHINSATQSVAKKIIIVH